MRAPKVIENPPPKAFGVSTGSNRISTFLNRKEQTAQAVAIPIPGAGPLGISGGQIVAPANPVATALSENVSDLQSFDGILLPNTGLHVSIPGISFYFPFFIGTNSPNNLNARPNTQGQARSFVNYLQGQGYKIGAGKFSTVELFNPNKNQVQFRIVVGGGVPTGQDEFIDHGVTIAGTSVTVPVQIVSGQNVVSVATQNAATFAVGFKQRVGGWNNSLGGGATQDITDGFLGKSRKQVIICNNDAAGNSLQILDSTSNIVGTVLQSTAFTFESGGDVKLFNPNAGAVSCNIGEVYYS